VSERRASGRSFSIRPSYFFPASPPIAVRSALLLPDQRPASDAFARIGADGQEAYGGTVRPIMNRFSEDSDCAPAPANSFERAGVNLAESRIFSIAAADGLFR